ncbi:MULTISPECIES: hypothetical protein [unclassified Variovorax]|uniref:hypothetical protein n=1 Tax=unclassified Variovorax TaxID=663243 RepID=UPI000C9BC456|nr:MULTISPECIES: hypothetical protein [unclassified Variovorax]PNG50107.1 hypothetical protein CHC06_05730 [Variovorax sp. B2]PNG50979.1 hypothetical protein CHC07_05635 [Variovorax sp. B4]VTV17141.1 hypothetical protein WDL1P1_00144 [Variovorax sp. WDL1]
MWQPLTPEEALVVLPTGGKRTISQTVLSGRLAMEPVPPADTKSWTSQFRRDGAAPGSIASLNGTRSQVFAQAVKATSMWLQAQGFGSFSCRASLLACAGAQYHHDATYFPNDVFCVLWLSDKTPWDVYFPFLERRIPLELGTVLAFDSAQPHGVVARDCVEFHPDSFRGAPVASDNYLEWSTTTIVSG